MRQAGRIVAIVLEKLKEKIRPGMPTKELDIIAAREIEDTPAFGANVETDFILGMGKVKEKVIILLDIDCVMNSDSFDLKGLVNQEQSTTTHN